MAEERTRNWTGIIYPESAPKDWREYLKATLTPVAISPLHTEPGLNEDEIKPHHHIFLKFDSVKSYKQVTELLEPLNGTIPKRVNSPIGLVRYFIHKDNPEKQQFDFSEITVYNGFDIEMYDSYTDKELNVLLADIVKDIRNGEIYEFSDLIDLYAGNGEFDRFSIVRKNAMFINSYITSFRNKAKQRYFEVQRSRYEKNDTKLEETMWR